MNAPGQRPAVTELRLTAYKTHRRAVFPLGPVTLFTGPSGSGKSGALEAYAALARLAAGDQLAEVFPDPAGCVPRQARPDAQGRRGFRIGCTVDGPVGPVRLDVAVQAEPELRIVGERMSGAGEILLETALRDPSRHTVQAAWYTAGSVPVTRAPLPDDRLATALLPLRIAGKTAGQRLALAAAEQVVVALRSVFACDPRPETMRAVTKRSDGQLRGGCDNLAAVLYRTRKECGTRHAALVTAVRAGCAGPAVRELTVEKAGPNGSNGSNGSHPGTPGRAGGGHRPAGGTAGGQAAAGADGECGGFGGAGGFGARGDAGGLGGQAGAGVQSGAGVQTGAGVRAVLGLGEYGRMPIERLGDGELRYLALALVLLTGPGVLDVDPVADVLPALQTLTVLADGFDRCLDQRQARLLLELAGRMCERGHIRLVGAVHEVPRAAALGGEGDDGGVRDGYRDDDAEAVRDGAGDGARSGDPRGGAARSGSAAGGSGAGSDGAANPRGGERTDRGKDTGPDGGRPGAYGAFGTADAAGVPRTSGAAGAPGVGKGAFGVPGLTVVDLGRDQGTPSRS
ncbi:biotin transporter BioY [Streptomyces zagrosensis]|uniref:Energy-coupling factor transporter ATP-binding protein EcfA2 n=1 Tax=Streptomyces zagrosensis TaxID=1042984 RepID=A0A7W9V350_9ACTN|nr:biotin transporter BioY [Streptomyces zagrosensis]MBB5939916.1 energy-coupling factor transporter ATP-binding protein EcfA2 [Streptomyces zagrosensis]